MDKIKRSAFTFRIVFYILLVLLPILTAVNWIMFNTLPFSIQSNILKDINASVHLPIPLASRLVGLASGMIPLALNIAVLFVLIRLCRLYEAGKFFCKENVSCYHTLGILIMLLVPVGILYRALSVFSFTFSNPPGERAVSLTLGTNDVTLILIGIGVMVISRIMDEGRKLQEEQNLTV